jgi:hypothetical protein
MAPSIAASAGETALWSAGLLVFQLSTRNHGCSDCGPHGFTGEWLGRRGVFLRFFRFFVGFLLTFSHDELRNESDFWTAHFTRRLQQFPFNVNKKTPLASHLARCRNTRQFTGLALATIARKKLEHLVHGAKSGPINQIATISLLRNKTGVCQLFQVERQPGTGQAEFSGNTSRGHTRVAGHHQLPEYL